MSRIQFGHRALMACLPLTLLVAIPAQDRIFDPFPYFPMSPDPPLFTDPPPPKCCVPSAITPPSGMGCDTPCDGQADCSGDFIYAGYTSAQCIVPPVGGGWCARTGETVYVPGNICMAVECTINGEPGEECRWILLFGSGYTGIGLKCTSGSVVCN